MQMNEYDIVGSEVIDYEIDRMDNPLKKEKVKELSLIRKRHIQVEEAVIERAGKISGLGFGAYDALHSACAEKGRVDVFLTTDKKLLRSAERHQRELAVWVTNPLPWLMGEKEE
ncbi:MAG TPA: PIN domain-containing protein [Spirochaetia bacterium]|nr:PIN domain-containing protein [Spirochaetia bacterium]